MAEVGAGGVLGVPRERKSDCSTRRAVCSTTARGRPPGSRRQTVLGGYRGAALAQPLAGAGVPAPESSRAALPVVADRAFEFRKQHAAHDHHEPHQRDDPEHVRSCRAYLPASRASSAPKQNARKHGCLSLRARAQANTGADDASGQRPRALLDEGKRRNERHQKRDELRPRWCRTGMSFRQRHDHQRSSGIGRTRNVGPALRHKEHPQQEAPKQHGAHDAGERSRCRRPCTKAIRKPHANLCKARAPFTSFQEQKVKEHSCKTEVCASRVCVRVCTHAPAVPLPKRPLVFERPAARPEPLHPAAHRTHRHYK